MFSVLGVAGGLALLLVLPGCPVTNPLPTQAQIEDLTLADGGGKYYLYVPSTYDRRRAYPLVIACHGTNPWDSAYSQIREWALFAEQSGIIVAAPVLTGTKGDFRPPAPEQIRRQQADERTLLALVTAIKAARNVAEEQVFMTGWSAGSFAILHTGLNHPELFRALAIRQGTFNPEFMTASDERLDRWQPIFVYYGVMDPLRDESLKCIAWLRDHKLFVESREMLGGHKREDVRVSWDFFRKVVRERPWVRPRFARTDLSNRGAVRFWCDSQPAYVGIRWDFGDGQTSDEPAPQHEYAAPGRYDAACTVRLKSGKSYRRPLAVQIGPPGG
ncbi:MAG: PKD domain-containing protein [Phycisphaerae bacterium]